VLGIAKKKPGFTELAVFLCALGVIVSMAVPAWVHHRKSASLERLVLQAAWHRDELSRWFHSPVSPSRLPAGDADTRNFQPGAGGEPRDLKAIVQTYVRYYRDSNTPDARTPGTSLFLEARGASTDACRRDGKIHIVPIFDESGDLREARIVATNRGRSGGPRDDGILAVYSVSGALPQAPSTASEERG
jgi:hypothetical protein